MTSLTCFKAYDIRGRLGDELDAGIAYRIGRATGLYLKARSVVIGGDVRPTSAELKAALSDGLRDSGADVIDLGLTGTEEIYFATFHLGVDGGIEVTASHNPIAYNGMKMVRAGARPISGETGLDEIRRLAEANDFPAPACRGGYTQASTRDAYVDHLLSYIDIGKLPPLRLVVNAGNGTAGPTIDTVEARFRASGVPVEIVKINHEPDGSFPNGIPNPLLVENRQVTRDAVLAHGAHMGIAWDGDFDRCFLFDEKGGFVEGYYMVALLAEYFLAREPGAAIIYDPRLTWNTVDIVRKQGGRPVLSRTGHSFFKEAMRREDAAYGGEISAHHYFRDFAYCDSGMIPWLLILEILARKGVPLSRMIEGYESAFPVSGELNCRAADPAAAIARIRARYEPDSRAIDLTDGVGLEFADWRFNLRSSNTEPLLRLNVEARGDNALLERKTRELLELLR